MQQFYEQPQTTGRRDLSALFSQNHSKTGNDQFVPFTQERDKLGRLISRQNKHRDRMESHSLPSKQLQRNVYNPQGKISEKVKLSNRVVERMFKLHDLKDAKSAKQLHKMRILSTASRDSNSTPTIGHYDTALIADKIKYRKSNLIAMGNPKSSTQLLTQHHSTSLQTTKPLTYRHPPNDETNLHSKPKLKELLKMQINYDLPQLQKYHEMKKLKIKHYDNFQENHLKFKDLVRHSLVLANQIKKGLQLD